MWIAERDEVDLFDAVQTAFTQTAHKSNVQLKQKIDVNTRSGMKASFSFKYLDFTPGFLSFQEHNVVNVLCFWMYLCSVKLFCILNLH